MTSIASSSSLRGRLELAAQSVGKITLFLALLAVPALPYAVLRFLIEGSLCVHWSLTAVITLACLAFCAYRIVPAVTSSFASNWWKTGINVNSALGMYIFVGVFALTATAAFGGLSAILYQVRPSWVQYTTTRDSITSGALTDLYAWHLLDMVPAIDIWKSLGVDAPPVTSATRAGGLLVLAYKIIIAFPLITIACRWIAWRMDTAKKLA
ncbi:hypothetical protein PHYC_01728 [Phycisphaerales bacterium]|nr:hypothetical protein PHYC_01728 [Phycisphaerales bacterium]